MTRKFPFAGIAFLFSIGILAGPTLARLTSAFSIILGANLFLVLLIPLLVRFGSMEKLSFSPLLVTCTLALITISMGSLRMMISSRYPSHHIFHLTGDLPEATLLGEILSPPTINDYSTRFVLDVQRIYASNKTRRASGQVLVSIGPHEETLVPGASWLVKGRLGLPPSRRNPGAFDYRTYLTQRGITAIFEAEDLYPVPANNRIAQFGRGEVYKIQQEILKILDLYVPHTEPRAILTALLLGDPSSIDAPTKSNFRQTGLTHVLAVSGLHVMLVGFLIYNLCRPMCLRAGCSWIQTEWIRSLVTLSILFIYTFVTGAKAPVVRAVLTALLLISSPLFRRPVNQINALGVAALLLLVYRPAYLYDVGFQLSFSAVLSILLGLPVLVKALPSAWLERAWARAPIQSVLVSISATAGTLPILLYHFGSISFAGILLNLAALPLTAASLSAGLTLVAVAPFSDYIASLLGLAAENLLLALLFVVGRGARLFAFLTFKQSTTALAAHLMLLVYGAMLAAAYSRKYRWKFMLGVLTTAAVATWGYALFEAGKAELSIVFFDVGHGDACFIQFPNGKNLLIDTGDSSRYGDQGRQVILPFLDREGIGGLDAILITHPHRDHMGGLQSLLASVPVGRLIEGGSQAGVLRREIFERTAPDAGSLISTRSVAAGDTLLLDPLVRVRILSPSAELYGHANLNEHSVVVQIQFGTTRFLFLGDAEAAAEQLLADRYPAFLQSDVVKIGHHGSNTSSSERFLTHLRRADKPPPLALISVGDAEGYGLPDEEVLARLRSIYATSHVTADEGALWLKSDGSRIWEVAY